MRRFRSFLLTIATSAILAVLVAWACALWSPYTHHTRPADERLVDGYPDTVPGPDGSRAWWFTRFGFGAMEAVPSGARGAEGQFLYWRGSHTPAYYRSGWPMLSMQSVVRFHQDATGRYLAGWELPRGEILRRGLQTGELPAWLRAQAERRLPLVPLWIGLVIDTLLYFAALVGLRYLRLRFMKRTPNHALQRTRPERSAYHPHLPQAGSLSLGRTAAEERSAG